MAFAHSKNKRRQRQELVEHLTHVAEQAALFAEGYGARDLAYVSGLLHDIGKFNPTWQQYLLNAEAQPTIKQKGPGHKGAGAVYGEQLGSPLVAFLIAAHHGGLPSLADLKAQLREWSGDSATQESQALALQASPQISAFTAPTLPAYAEQGPLPLEMFLRMAFSALVDADFLDTERHFTPDKETNRAGAPDLGKIWEEFAANQGTVTGQHDDPVNRVRDNVYQACLEAADLEPGFFRLTVPTGGGKTRSSLAFALRHAQTHSLRRVVYAIPYTSIIDQTVSEFRKIFTADPRAVLEHHSAVSGPEDRDNPTPGEIWTRLAAENWDAPLIVTTTVQLFESLLGRKPTVCRKLHNLAGSVIILDEAQMLPTHLLTTILDVLCELVAHYGVTVVLCTATQPALDERSDFRGLPNVREIIAQPERLFRDLARVRYEWPAAREQWAWERVAEEMRASPQALAIVNTRANARALREALDDEQALHLSTRLCGAHRRAVLDDARERLKREEPCRLVATQVIEAGVDVDFPLALRALGPLDRIVQAAGRCNREGRLEMGRVVIFDPEEGRLPPGAYRVGTQLTKSLALSGEADLHDPALYTRYFEDFYREVDRDQEQVQKWRTALDYPETAERFRMIADDTEPVVVRYSSSEALLGKLRAQSGSPRELLRALQPYIVGLSSYELAQAKKQRLVEEVIPGLYEWLGEYDTEHGTGIVLNGPINPERLITGIDW